MKEFTKSSKIIYLVEMSAAFKLAKKKVNQHDLRRLMQEQKNSRGDQSSITKIDSPFAKYEGSQLSCQLCKKPVSTNAVWKVHVNSKQHKDNLAHAKLLKEKLTIHREEPTIQQRVAALKEGQKLKGILKNSSSASAPPRVENSVDTEETSSTLSTNSCIPDDFFDVKKTSSSNPLSSTQKESEEPPQTDETLPQGFFDDPVKDAKARHLEYKDPIEEEWDKFRKEIKEAEVQSLTIINEEQEESTTERQIDEIDAQIKNWSRYVNIQMVIL